MDKRIVLAREDLKKTNYWMITLMISALTLIILSLTNDHDERKLFIADKVGGNFSFTFEIITMALVSVIAPLYSFDLLLGIVACIFIIIIIRGCLYLYYNHKY